MKKLGNMRLLTLLFTMVFVVVLAGCSSNKSGSTIDEPEITAEYLAEDYSQQLMTDGAETISGSVAIEKSGDSYTVHITEIDVVPNEGYDEGYYLADTNVTKDVSLGDEARIVCEEEDELIVATADGFMENHPDGSDELYTVYLMGDSAELILLVDPESLISE